MADTVRGAKQTTFLRLPNKMGIVLKFGMKVPGPGFDVKQVMMDFSYDQLGGRATGDAYARLIEDCIQGDPTRHVIVGRHDLVVLAARKVGACAEGAEKQYSQRIPS